MRPVLSAFLSTVLVLLVGCGGSGGSSGGGGTGGGGSSGPDVTVLATFEQATRTVPGYADALRVKVTPPPNVSLPPGVPSEFELTRSQTSRVLGGLKPSGTPYLLQMEALTDGVVVGTAQRSIFVTAGDDMQVDVSTNLNSQIASVVVEGAQTVFMDDNSQLTAHARNAAGQTLFSGLGFSWVSSDPRVLFVDLDTGLAIGRLPGTVTVQATLKGTTLKGSLEVTVTGDPFVTVTPGSASLDVHDPKQFEAEVTGLSNSNVTWSVDEPGGGTVTSTGLYTAPLTPGTYHVRATSVDYPAATATATITVVNVEGWVAYSIHPPGATSSGAYFVRDGKIGGAVAWIGDENDHAALWDITSGECTDLNPPSYERGIIGGIHGGQQVGFGFTSIARALLWTGTAESAVELTPSGYQGSVASDVYAGTQVGYVIMDGKWFARKWSGSAASVQILHPSGASESWCLGVYDDQQVGVSVFSGVEHASLWHGSAASWASLMPAGATKSYAAAVSNGIQVGAAYFGGMEHAGLWTGTASSWVDLHPTGWEKSWLSGVHAGQQVGSVRTGNDHRAAIWSGTAASFRNLHKYLPEEFDNSFARSIWHDGNTTYVVGSASVIQTLRVEAFVWIRTTGG